MQEKKKKNSKRVVKGEKLLGVIARYQPIIDYGRIYPQVALNKILVSFIIDSVEEKKPQNQTPPFLCKTQLLQSIARLMFGNTEPNTT